MAQLSHINIPDRPAIMWKALMRRLGFAEQGAQDFADALDREIADRSTKLDLKELELRIVRWIFLAVGLAAGVIIAAIGVMIRFLT